MSLYTQVMHPSIPFVHIGLWSTNQLLKDDVQYKYNIAAASIARAIGTILWVLLLLIPLVQVSVIIKGLGNK